MWCFFFNLQFYIYIYIVYISYRINDEHSSFEEILVNKLGVDVLLLMLGTLRFCKSFQSDNYVHYDLNNSALDFLI